MTPDDDLILDSPNFRPRALKEFGVRGFVTDEEFARALERLLWRERIEEYWKARGYVKR